MRHVLFRRAQMSHVSMFARNLSIYIDMTIYLHLAPSHTYTIRTYVSLIRYVDTYGYVCESICTLPYSIRRYVWIRLSIYLYITLFDT